MNIEKGVPLPEVTRSKYPWDAMEHGDSILFPADKAETARLAAYTWLKRHRPTWRVVKRVEGDNVRLWFVDETPMV